MHPTSVRIDEFSDVACGGRPAFGRFTDAHRHRAVLAPCKGIGRRCKFCSRSCIGQSAVLVRTGEFPQSSQERISFFLVARYVQCPAPGSIATPASLELVLEHPSVESQVVSDQDGTVQAGCNSTHDFRKGWKQPRPSKQ